MNRILLVALVVIAGIAGWWLMQERGEEPLIAVVDYTAQAGEDGVALVDLNPRSATFGEILQKFPIGAGVSPHHPYANRDGSKLYTTALGGERLYRIWIEDERIARITPIDTGECVVGEDLHFSEDGARFYLTCMGSDQIAVFDGQTDQLIEALEAPGPDAPYIKYPHGIAVDESIDRMIVTETISAALDDPGSGVVVIAFSSGEALANVPLVKTEGVPSAPVEVMFLPDEPIAYVTGMLDASLWRMRWDAEAQAFEAALADDGAPRGQSWPLAMSLGPDGKLFVSFAQPGEVNVYDLQAPGAPKLIRTLSAEAGAHHLAFSEDGRYLFVQNNLLGLEGMNAGTITVLDLKSGERVATVETFLEQGLLPTSLMLLGQVGH